MKPSTIELQKDLIKRYKAYLSVSEIKDEIYKWHAIENFQQHWDIDAENFDKMFRRAFKKRENLFYQNSWGFITKALKKYPEKLREMFKDLYNETEPLNERIDSFQKSAIELLPALKKELGKEKMNHQQDERTISVYLALRFPEKYFLYMYSFYEKYCQLINETLPTSGDRYIHYLSIAEKFKNETVLQDSELLQLHKELNPGYTWADTNLIIQNILYTMLEQNQEANNLMHLKPLIDAFEHYYVASGHSDNENLYKDTLNLEYVQGLSKKAFIEYFFEFARDGGGIQSKGYRTAPMFKKSLEENFKKAKSFLIQPFSKEFNAVEWLNRLDEFKGLGSGLATIYLNRINNQEYCVVNNKSAEAFTKLGFPIKGKISTQHNQIKDVSAKLIEAFPSLNNFYKTDALAHFIIGVDEGRNSVDGLINNVNYWIFQGNLHIYNVVGALNANALKSWTVTAHKDRIKIGDKVILWVTGEKSGCYALCKVTSEVENRLDDKAEQQFYTDSSKNESHDRVDLEIKYNFSDQPIFKDQLFSLPEFSSFNAGKQGTNNTATREQYDKILMLYWENRLLQTLKEVADRKKIEWFFNLSDKIVEDLDLLTEDPRISFTTPKNDKNRIAVTIGQRYVIELSNENNASKPSTRFQMIAMSKDFEIFKKHPGFTKFEAYKSKSKETTPPSFAYFDDSAFPQDDELIEVWLEAVEFEYTRAEKSSFRENHNPMFFKAVVDAAYRQYILDKIFNSEIKMDNHPLNQIFFGPPGTGKTYNTINEAVKIVDPVFYSEYKDVRNKLRERFNQLMINDWKNPQKGQISFCTFHQSFTYEDFIEGIKPVLAGEHDAEISAENEDKLKYKIEDGIFKLMADRAKHFADGAAKQDKQRINLPENEFKKSQFYKLSLGDINVPEDQEIYDYCIENNCIAIGFMATFDLTGKDEHSIYLLAEKEKLGRFDAQAMSYFNSYLKTGNYVLISKGNRKVRAIGKVTGEYYYEKDSPIRYNHFRKIDWIITNSDIPVEEVYEKSFSQQTIYKLNSDWINKAFFVHSPTPNNEEEVPDFVLIIDEINRGNISQIFGELITLIEKDKRSGNPEALEVTLPYSKSKFSIPANIHLIGTMNTADRSIEALDTALRRRFTFVEMPPKPHIISDYGKSKGEIDGINLVQLLETINSRIEKLIDKDHQIGHSYFLDAVSLEDLKQVFKNKIIPLLEEYFYGDFGKIGLVLGTAFVLEKARDNFKFANFKGFDSDIISDLKERKVYQISSDESWTIEGFKAIYS